MDQNQDNAEYNQPIMLTRRQRKHQLFRRSFVAGFVVSIWSIFIFFMGIESPGTGTVLYGVCCFPWIIIIIVTIIEMMKIYPRKQSK